MSILKLEHVFYRYPKASEFVLKDVNCAFEKGQINAIVGSSGSGKTTILSLLAGLDVPTEGEIILKGESIRDMDPDEYRREKISMIFQSFELFPLLSALENITFPLEYRGIKKEEAKERAQTVLSSLGIDESKQRRYPSNLSGGEQQRVAISRTLATGAEVILADEPTGNLDDTNAENVMEILKHLAHEAGLCVIIVTHDMEIAKTCDRMWLISEGQLSLDQN